MLAIQFLEPGPDTGRLKPSDAALCLRQAFDHLPFDLLILGWDLPDPLVETCAREAQRFGLQLYLWYPLLTGSAKYPPPAGWQTQNLFGNAIAGFQDMPEFTFICPNHPEALENRLTHLQKSLDGSPYDGVFLDRIRFPSPTPGLDKHLACFCEHCQRTAREEGIELAQVRNKIVKGLGNVEFLIELVRGLLDRSGSTRRTSQHLAEWPGFRERSITKAVRAASACARSLGKKVGLDCFAPSLTRLVGQDLSDLSQSCDWIKVMVYAHTYAPAGMPYEFLNLLEYLESRNAIAAGEIPPWFSRSCQTEMPSTSHELRESGISPQGLRADLQKGMARVNCTLLAGIELVDLPGAARVQDAQVEADLGGLTGLPLGGLVLSWDLWHIPPERLSMVQRWLRKNPLTSP